MEFIVGQRWISHSETQLGLGIVTEAANRRIKMLFPAVGESRIYAIDTAPLSRIQYNIGDKIIDNNEVSIVINEIKDDQGLLTYSGTNANGEITNIHELDLNSFVQFTTPQQRLFSGQLDKNKNYSLRIQTLLHTHHLQQSPVKGLLGSRTNLLPHQIYIANNVSRRHAPRVLLADEVGLGKTIEAGMILHHQLHTGQASRVLILVPDSLVHQWLVEMLRRFNVSFSIFDQDRVSTLLSEGYTNPFEAEQLVLCPLSLLCHSEEIIKHALTTSWDLVIVDEAHHLRWSPNEVSKEYSCVEKIAAITESLLLLTATPEQVGLESHFARLRLLDPARYHDYEKFQNDGENFEKVNSLVQNLLTSQPLDSSQQNYIEELLGDSYCDDNQENISKLLDRHGTGRVLFRNTRSTVQGFPKRIAHLYPLELPESSNISKTELYPEIFLSDDEWLTSDPRVNWLVETLQSQKPNKVLVICHHSETAVALDNYLNLRMGIRSTSFYEGLSIVERDRAAAYFAEGSNPDDIDSSSGAQVLVCSEIGSEGRNFQFAHHLILFDMPLNPDLLEQRIGRLDRIGQSEDIQIHVPYLKNTSQEVLVKWIHEGINLLCQSCSASYEIYQKFSAPLHELLKINNNEKDLNTLIEETATFTKELVKKLSEGRDRLLEISSCNSDQADQLISQIRQYDNHTVLSDYMEKVFEQFGVNSEFHSDHSYIIRPSDHMHANFPGLRDDGNTITFDRNKALSREDMEFLSWEHPMVSESMDMIRNSEFGSTAVAVASIEGLPKGTLLLETWFTINIIANKQLQLDRYLPIHPARILLDNNLKSYNKSISSEHLHSLCTSVPKKTALAIIKQTRNVLQEVLTQSQSIADSMVDKIRSAAIDEMTTDLGNELERLTTLRKVNLSIRNDEIEYLQSRILESKDLINRSRYQLQAVRVVVNN